MKVLVIEDEKELSDSICTYLADEKFVCEKAYDFHSAVEKISLYDYACIILDVNLPMKSGLDVLSWIRQYPSLKEIPVFMLSTSDHPDQIARAFELRTDSYFIKPADVNELQTVVEGMLGFWHSRTHRRLPRSRPDPGIPFA